MNEHKHTKGPWRVSNDGNDIETSHEDSPTGICSMYLYEQSEADAKLIAAAPEILEALQIAHKALFDAYMKTEGAAGDELKVAFDVVQSAIQKATQP